MPKAKRTTKAGLKKKKKTFTKFISVFKEEVSLAGFKCNKEIAREYSKEAKDVIERQRYNWHPLSPRYLKDKVSKGYDHRIYIRTGELLASISWGVTHGKVWTGIPSRVKHVGKFANPDEPKREPTPMWLLARWLEYGTFDWVEVVKKVKGKKKITTIKTVRIPPRPIWRPLLSKYVRIKPKFGKRYRKAMDQAIRRKAKVAAK